MFLSDGTLIDWGHELLNPFDYRAVQPCSVDLRIDSDIDIYPSTFKLASTIERVVMPLDLGARVEGKSTLGRRGLFIHVSAGWIDPGFKGTITLELFNASDNLITLNKGEYICQIAFFMLDKPALKGYDGKYQGQSGVTRARL